jgi:hypothetical protein
MRQERAHVGGSAASYGRKPRAHARAPHPRQPLRGGGSAPFFRRSGALKEKSHLIFFIFAAVILRLCIPLFICASSFSKQPPRDKFCHAQSPPAPVCNGAQTDGHVKT